MKLGHEDDVVSQEHLCCDCSYCHRYAVAFILARLWLLLQQHDIEVADVVSQIRGQLYNLESLRFNRDILS